MMSSPDKPTNHSDDERAEPASVDRAAADTVLNDVGSSDELGQLRNELDQSRERALRAQAELENIRKRSRRELEDERRFANLSLLRELLPVIDNVGRAIRAAEQSRDSSSLLEGIKLVAQQLEAVLAQHNCRRIDALQKPFDPHLHAAISPRPTSEYPPNTVVEVVQDGFLLHDRVLRPAQVIVSMAPPEASPGQPETSSNADSPAESRSGTSGDGRAAAKK